MHHMLLSLPACPPACLRTAQGGAPTSSVLVNLEQWVHPDDWFQYASQVSNPVTLAAGQPILLEGAHMNTVNGGNLQVIIMGMNRAGHACHMLLHVRGRGAPAATAPPPPVGLHM
jgi:hypothetical protein